MLAAVLAAGVLVVASNLVLWTISRGLLVSGPEELADRLAGTEPSDVVVLIPGARVHPTGEPSRPLIARLEAGAAVYADGLAGHVLVSGDNRFGHYDEPTVMRRHVHWLGVPLDDISVDYAGFDTWDTCLRAYRIFGAGQGSTMVVFVTQERYGKRAASLCRAAGLDVTVMTVPNPPSRPRGIWLKAIVRERLAAVKGVFEVMFTPSPTFLGPFEGLRGSENPANPDPSLGES
jgi:vancomycin permeability regulator SanA